MTNRRPKMLTSMRAGGLGVPEGTCCVACKSLIAKNHAVVEFEPWAGIYIWAHTGCVRSAMETFVRKKEARG